MGLLKDSVVLWLTMKAERPRAKSAPTATGARPRMVSRSVRNCRYSDCGSADLKDLDWERGWWTDNSFGAHYLHVWHKDGETIHRVFCRGHETPRLEMVRGKLMWLYTPNDPRPAAAGGKGMNLESDEHPPLAAPPCSASLDVADCCISLDEARDVICRRERYADELVAWMNARRNAPDFTTLGMIQERLRPLCSKPNATAQAPIPAPKDL